MSGAKAGYTPEPWVEGHSGNCNVVRYDGDDIRPIARIPGQDNRRRIVAAVNAVAGLPNAALEAGVVAKLVRAAESQEAADVHYDSCDWCGRGLSPCPQYTKLTEESVTLRRAALALLRGAPRAD